MEGAAAVAAVEASAVPEVVPGRAVEVDRVVRAAGAVVAAQVAAGEVSSDLHDCRDHVCGKIVPVGICNRS